MVKLNLQLFAQKLNVDTSIVDYLKSTGQNSSYDARKQLASSLGISNYSGSAEQNIAMLNALKNGSQQSSPAPSNPNVAGSGGSSINGVDQATIDKMKSTFQQSSQVSNAQAEANKYLDNLKQFSSITNIVDQSTWDAINKQFSASTAYQDAMNYTNQLLQQLSSGKTSYSDQIDSLIGEIQNRDKFEYDVDSDTLFQQALASAMSSGKTAMQDTMGQAAALTGGYGSTYATSAANQTYNAFIEDAYNNLPEYYQMALEAYQMEGEEMYNQLAMLNDASNTEWQRLYDSWGANFNNAQQMYQNEYSAWQDSVNNAFNSANLQLQEHGQLYDQAYNTYNAVQDNANTLYSQEYQKWADEVNNAFNYAGLANSDYWDTQNFIESQKQFQKELDYKYTALKQDNDQFYASLNAKSSSGGGGSDGNFKEPTANQYSEIIRILNEEGEDAMYKYVDSLGANIDVEAINNHINQYGRGNVSGRTFSIISPGESVRYAGKINHGVFRDQYGNDYTLEEIEAIDPSAADKLRNLKKGQKVTIN